MQSLVSLRLAQERATRAAATPADAVRSAQIRLDGAVVHAPSRARWECGRGCAFCCHLQVLVTPPEVAALVPFVTDEIRARIAANAARAAGLDAGEYRRARIPCAFLDANGGCSAYEARPLRCRAHSSTDVGACQSAFDEDTPTDAVPTDPWLRQAATAIQSGLTPERDAANSAELHASLTAFR
ncbi:MAG: YkgJ family cysteine cluster protein [Planctomycetota bacterium]